MGLPWCWGGWRGWGALCTQARSQEVPDMGSEERPLEQTLFRTFVYLHIVTVGSQSPLPRAEWLLSTPL